MAGGAEEYQSEDQGEQRIVPNNKKAFFLNLAAHDVLAAMALY